jgi:predicted DNA-binding ribbon-helix-helix protein
MQARKLHSATVRLDTPTWKHVEELAKADRRPVSQLLRNLIADAVAANAGKSTKQAVA